jgi:gamma-glutamyltranspeptidase
MSNYHAYVREPLCFDYPVPAQQREYRICGMPPPSPGNWRSAKILARCAPSDELPPALQDGQPTPEWLHAYTEAARLALADRQLYVGDPVLVAPPGGSWSRLLEPAYLAKRARLINLTGRAHAPGPGGRSHRRHQARGLRAHARANRARHLAHLGGRRLRQRGGHDQQHRGRMGCRTSWSTGA